MKPRKISRKALTTGHILIVDDHEVVRRGLRSLLSSRPEWTICGEAVDGFDAVEKAKTLRPAVVLMDISMPRMNGLDASRIIRRDLPESKVVIIPLPKSSKPEDVVPHGDMDQSLQIAG